MPSYLAPGLTPETASRICRLECRAQCCRGPLLLQLSGPEALAFRAHAAALGVALKLEESADGSSSVAFLEHEGGHCPMLDDATSTCRIYEDRPQRCRDFPDRPRRGCLISGAEAEGDRPTRRWR
jgi:Fe-S-cluster containining protein